LRSSSKLGSTVDWAHRVLVLGNDVLVGSGDGHGEAAGVREYGVGAVRLGHGNPPDSGQLVMLTGSYVLTLDDELPQSARIVPHLSGCYDRGVDKVSGEG